MATVGDRVLRRLHSGDATLTKLKLDFCPTAQHATELLQLLPHNSDIIYVLLDRRFVHALSPAVYRSMLTAIGQMPAIQELEIWNVIVPLSHVCRALSPTKTLHKLGLAFVGLYDLRNCEHLAHHTSLRQVYLSEFRIADGVTEQAEGAAATTTAADSTQQELEEANDPEEVVPNFDSFLRALSTCPALETIEMFSSRADGDPWSPEALASLVTSDSLRSLTLRRLHLGTPHVLALAAALEMNRNKPLRVLDLSENYLGDPASVAVVRSIVSHQHLKSLLLRDSSITGAGCRQLANALMQRPAEQRQEESNNDNDDDNNNDDDSNTNDDRATTGDDNDEDAAVVVPASDSAPPLAAATATNTTRMSLEKLNLSSNPIKDRGARALAELLSFEPCSSLQHLEITSANITDTGCVALAAAVRDNTTLQSLGLAYNTMKTATYTAFAEALTTNRSLKSIYLQASRINIGLEGCQALVDMLQDNMVLENVSTLLADSLDRERNAYKEMIATYLRLNCAGRRNLFLGRRPGKRDWIEAIAKVSDDLNAIYYLVKAQPSICTR